MYHAEHNWHTLLTTYAPTPCSQKIRCVLISDWNSWAKTPCSFGSHTSSKKQPQNANCKTHGTIYPWLNRHNCKLLLCDHLNGVWTALNKNSNDLESITEALGVDKKPQTSEYMQLAWCHKHYVFAIAIRNCNGRMNSMNSLGNQWVLYELRHSIDVATDCSVLWSKSVCLTCQIPAIP